MVEMIGADHLSHEDRERLLLQALGGSPEKARQLDHDVQLFDVLEGGVRRYGASFLPMGNLTFRLQVVASTAQPAPRWTWIRFVGGQRRLFAPRTAASSVTPTSAFATA